MGVVRNVVALQASTSGHRMRSRLPSKVPCCPPQLVTESHYFEDFIFDRLRGEMAASRGLRRLAHIGIHPLPRTLLRQQSGLPTARLMPDARAIEVAENDRTVPLSFGIAPGIAYTFFVDFSAFVAQPQQRPAGRPES